MKGLVLLVAVLTLVTFASGVMAQQTPATKSAAPTPAAPEKKARTAPAALEKTKVQKEERFIGKVSTMDVAAKTVVVKNPEAEKTFTVGDTTKITRGGKKMVLPDLKRGMNVSVSYKMEAGKATAATIIVAPPKPTAEATPKRSMVRPSETPAE